MSAIKLWVRIVAAIVGTMGFMASCGQLLGDFEIVQQSTNPLEIDAGTEARPIICTVGVTRCDGRLLQLCSDEGTAWATLEPCASAELCQASDVSTVSACIPPACATEQMSCDGNLLRLCNVSRTGWELFATCESAAHCDAGRRQCLPAPCEPGDRRCNVGNLERCNDDSTGWELLDACDTNELCEATLAPPAVAGEALSGGDVPAPAVSVVGNAEGPTECLEAICDPREVECDGTRLNACNEGRTEFVLAEECATAPLCLASITYTGLRGAPRCVRPTCAAGEHRCSVTGVLEVCNAARDGYDPIEACIGPPFCDAVAADRGEPGCKEAPCAAGDEQCNGPQIQRCLTDRTGFENVGAPCETRGLCNDEGASAVCAAPACQRGPLSGTEFRCDGATLLRCNDQHTGYDPIAACLTDGLCNAGLGFNGCQLPVCAPGETRCSGNFVQVCNEDRTGFVSVEQCQAGTCDSALGRCADPCDLGSARCNAQGNLEECRDRLVGREITARCGSVQLCDASARTCRTPPAGCTADGVRRCRADGQGSVLEVCTDGRSRFATLDTCAPGEVCDVNDQQCDVCVQGSEAGCENGALVTCAANGQTETSRTCDFGCQSVTNGPDRCRACVPGSIRCEGSQLVVCSSRGTEEFLERQSCDSAAICQNTLAACNASGAGEGCRCQPGECDPGDRDCRGDQPVACNADRTGFVADGPSCGPGDCNPRPAGECFACGERDVRCSDGVMQGCLSDRSGFADLPGARPGDVRCVSDNGGVRAQSCNGDTLVTDACESGLCTNGIGCAQCNPDDFDPECTTTADGRPAISVCLGGREDGPPLACEGTNGCVEATCQTGDCNTRSRARGTACARAGGNTGFCDGLASEPSCVECITAANCDDGIACTDDVCLASGACQHTPVSSRCDDGEFCNGTESCSVQSGCVEGAAQRCDDGNACTDDSCDEAGDRCATAFNTAACALPGGGAGVCGGGTCNALQVCDPDDAPFCDGAVLRGCNDAGTALEPIETCASAALCAPTGCIPPCDEAECASRRDAATCTSFACVNGTCEREEQSDCRGNQVCDGQGSCVRCTLDEHCPTGQVCEDNQCAARAPCGGATCAFGCNATTDSCNLCQAASCQDPVAGDCSTLQCAADGLSCVPADLEDGAACDGGSCTGGVCTASGGSNEGQGGTGNDDPGGEGGAGPVLPPSNDPGTGGQEGSGEGGSGQEPEPTDDGELTGGEDTTPPSTDDGDGDGAGPGGSCGNDICQAQAGEDSANCPEDCPP